MADDTPSTRDRLLDATVTLMRTKGAAASGTKEILDLAGAPRGSFYFHFPGGKDQLVLEALERGAAATLGLLTAALDGDADLADQIGAVFTAIEAELTSTDYAPGCAVAVTTLESSAISSTFQGAVAAAFATWTSTLTARFVERGMAVGAAEALADTVVAAMEGATLLARARRSPLPLRHTAALLTTTVHQLSGPRD